MNIHEVKERVALIEQMKGDYEIAHSEEDKLHVDFIKHIASLNIFPISGVAKEILKSSEIDFERYFA